MTGFPWMSTNPYKPSRMLSPRFKLYREKRAYMTSVLKSCFFLKLQLVLASFLSFLSTAFSFSCNHPFFMNNYPISVAWTEAAQDYKTLRTHTGDTWWTRHMPVPHVIAPGVEMNTSDCQISAKTGRSCVISTNGFGRWALFDPVSVWIDSPAWNIWPQCAVSSTLFKRNIIELCIIHCSIDYWFVSIAFLCSEILAVRLRRQSVRFISPLHLLSKPKHRLRRHSRLEKRQIVWLHFHKQSILFVANLLLYLLWGLCSCEAEHCTPSRRASYNKTNSLTHIQGVIDDIYNIKMKIACNELYSVNIFHLFCLGICEWNFNGWSFKYGTYGNMLSAFIKNRLKNSFRPEQGQNGCEKFPSSTITATKIPGIRRREENGVD